MELLLRRTLAAAAVLTVALLTILAVVTAATSGTAAGATAPVLGSPTCMAPYGARGDVASACTRLQLRVATTPDGPVTAPRRAAGDRGPGPATPAGTDPASWLGPVGDAGRE